MAKKWNLAKFRMWPKGRSLVLAAIATGGSFLVATEAIAQRARPNEPTFFEEGDRQLERAIEQLQRSQPAPVLTIDASLQQWQPISSRAGGFSVWAPIGVLSDATETIALDSQPLGFRVLAIQTAMGKFVVAYADAPAIETDRLFDSVTQALIDRTSFAVKTAQPIAVDGAVGRSLTLTGRDGAISAYLLRGNDRLYLVGVRQTNGSTATEAVDRFLKSFRLVPR